MFRGTRAVAVASLAGWFGWSEPAQAGNFDTFYLGNEAAMQAGAATASARRGSAIWYNPAGLARLDHSSIDANATALSLSLGDDVDVDSSLPGSEGTRLKSTALAIVPASLSYVRQLSFAGAGVALFVPNQQTQVLRTRLRAPNATSDRPYELSVDGHSVTQEYYAGPALGFALGPHVDLGFALLANYRTEVTHLAVLLALDGAAGSATALQRSTDDEQSLGLQPVAGLQLHLPRGWQAGLVVRAPSVRLYRQAQNVNMALSIAQTTETELELEDDFTDQTGFSSTLLTPLRVHLGLARELGDGQISAEASYRLPLRNRGEELNQRGVFNARLGGQLALNETLALGGGVFSDRSADRLSEEDSDGRDIDYYGASIGVQLDTQYGIVTRKGQTLQQPRPLIFRTTLVLSYLLGLGQLQRLELGQDADGGFSLTFLNRHVVDHQIVLNFGATLLD
jgi:hypothetical protein